MIFFGVTFISHCDFSKSFQLQTQQIKLYLLVFEPTFKSGINLDVILTSNSELLDVYVDSHLYSNHYLVLFC